jgi:hypothetical protein
MRFGNSSGTRIENDGEKEGRISENPDFLHLAPPLPYHELLYMGLKGKTFWEFD